MTGSTVAHVAAGGGSVRALTAADIAQAVGGRLVGDPGVTVTGLAPLDRAGASDLSFLSGGKYAGAFAQSGAGVVLVPEEFETATGRAKARIVVARPHEAMLALIPRFHPPATFEPGVHQTAVVGRGVRIGDGSAIGPYVVLGDGAVVGERVRIGAHCAVGAGVTIGDDTLLHPGVTLYPGTRLGARVILQSGVRAGSDGFGYVFRGGAHEKIPHVGRCIIQDDVEVGANTTIDRGSIDDTVIGAGTKIDNLVQVGHNVRIGRLCLLMSQVGISGSAHIEDGCIIAGQAGIGGHITIGAQARIGGQAGVFGSVPAGETWSGYPARPHKESLRAQAALFKLAGLMRRLERLLERDAT